MQTPRPTATGNSWDLRGFYAIVDPEQAGPAGPVALGEALLAGGCAILQLRAKTLPDDRLLALARALAERCRRQGVPFVVNDRPDIALSVRAAGVHLGQGDTPLRQARELLGSRCIGISTHDLEQAREALRGGADLIGFGPVFPTRTKRNPDPTVGLASLQRVCREASVPVVAIGGITVDNAPEVREAGAAMCCAISSVCQAPDPSAAARTLHQLLS